MSALDTYRPGLWRRIAVAGCRRGGSKPVRFDYVQSGHRIIERQYQSDSGRVHGYHHAQGATAADRRAIRRGRANAHASVPQVKDAIDTNASISSELTKITLKQAEAQNSGSDSGQAQSAQQSESSSSNAKKGGALTDEQKKQVEELMKANQQSTDTQSNTTQSEQKATQNKGTGATKPW